MRVAFGGTFDRIHRGHRAIIEKAFSIGDEVLVGITSDQMAEQARGHPVSPVAKRKEGLEAFLRSLGHKQFEVVEISDIYGPAPFLENLDGIIASEETKKTAEEINRMRMDNGLKPLDIHLTSMVLADDSCPISSSRIRSGEIDEEGKLQRPLVVNVGSKNKAKIWATRDIFLKVFKKVEIHGVEIETKASEIPTDEEAIEGAIGRAKEAIQKADFGVGIECGLFFNAELERGFFVQHCAIMDKRGVLTMGHGPGFVLPESIVADLRGGF
ncbi:MAG: pantetheine-phosphate adenylyltransferase, partial [Methanobacteriota archaeon]